MGKVLRLVRTTNKDTVVALDCLAKNARNGDVTGLALLYKTKDGTEEVIFTGAYAAHPDKAISAALRLSVKLTHVQEAMMPGAP